MKAEALPFLRIMFVFSSGMLVFFMLGGALRSAGDARTPMILGVAMTVLNIVLNVVLIRGLGPIPAFGTAGAAMGTCDRVRHSSRSTRCGSSGAAAGSCRSRAAHGFGPDWTIIRSLFRFGLPTGIQGIAMNIGGVLMLVVHRLARAERGGAGGVRRLVLAALLAHHVDVGRAHGRGRGGRRPEPRRRQSGSRRRRPCTSRRASGSAARRSSALFFLFFPRQLLAIFGMNEPAVVEIGAQLLRVLSVSGLFIAVALTYTGGLQGTGDTKSPLYISIVSQIIVPLGICFVIQADGHAASRSTSGSRSSSATRRAAR